MKPDSDKSTLFPILPTEAEIPKGVDRRAFLMRSAVVSAAVVLTGCEKPKEEAAAPPAAQPPKPKPSAISADLNVVAQSKGPVMTVIDEFYKVGPGPSSSHTIGPMRITYDFYQRCCRSRLRGRRTRRA